MEKLENYGYPSMIPSQNTDNAEEPKEHLLILFYAHFCLDSELHSVCIQNSCPSLHTSYDPNAQYTKPSTHLSMLIHAHTLPLKCMPIHAYKT